MSSLPKLGYYTIKYLFIDLRFQSPTDYRFFLTQLFTRTHLRHEQKTTHFDTICVIKISRFYPTDCYLFQRNAINYPLSIEGKNALQQRFCVQSHLRRRQH